MQLHLWIKITRTQSHPHKNADFYPLKNFQVRVSKSEEIEKVENQCIKCWFSGLYAEMCLCCADDNK